MFIIAITSNFCHPDPLRLPLYMGIDCATVCSVLPRFAVRAGGRAGGRSPAALGGDASLALALAQVGGVAEACGRVDALVLRPACLHRLDRHHELAEVALRRGAREAHEWRGSKPIGGLTV